MILLIQNKEQKEQIATTVLADLPEWFGLPESTAEYIECSKRLTFWAALEEDEIQGFIVLKETSPYTIEIYVMGVKKAYHRQQIGKKLFDACYIYAKEKGYEYLQVKTAKEGCYAEYDQTIAFYKRVGFKEFECFPTLWDEWNPCQIYIISIA